MISAVAFDLDDTLCLERDYVHSGFAAVARRLTELFAVEFDWLGRLWRDFEAGVRGNAFSRGRCHRRVDRAAGSLLSRARATDPVV